MFWVLKTSCGLSVLIHGVISLTDTKSCDEIFCYSKQFILQAHITHFYLLIKCSWLQTTLLLLRFLNMDVYGSSHTSNIGSMSVFSRG